MGLNYWDARYRNGGRSSDRDITASRAWKQRIITEYAGHLDAVVDVGCGDLTFWAAGVRPRAYTGIDISPSIIEENRRAHPDWTFHCSSAEVPVPGVSGRVVICQDMLFHVMDDAAYRQILRNLTRYAEEWLFIFTWHTNPFEWFPHSAVLAGRLLKRGRVREAVVALSMLDPPVTDGIYQKFRRLEDDRDLFTAAGFDLVATRPANEIGAMYVFHRRGTPAGGPHD